MGRGRIGAGSRHTDAERRLFDRGVTDTTMKSSEYYEEPSERSISVHSMVLAACLLWYKLLGLKRKDPPAKLSPLSARMGWHNLLDMPPTHSSDARPPFWAALRQSGGRARFPILTAPRYAPPCTLYRARDHSLALAFLHQSYREAPEQNQVFSSAAQKIKNALYATSAHRNRLL